MLDALFFSHHRVALRDPEVEHYRSALDALETRAMAAEHALFHRNVSMAERAVERAEGRYEAQWDSGSK